MIRLFDTHAHLVDEQFDADRDALIGGLLDRGVEIVLCVGCNEEEIKESLKLTEKYPFIYCAGGYHPHDSRLMRNEHFDLLKSLKTNGKFKAIGEIGLDFHYDYSPREVQREIFAKQLDLAHEIDLPVILHIREAQGEAMDIMRFRRGKNRGVVHCFSGSYETAVEYIDMGFYISFAGPLTYDNAARLREIAARLPMDRILIETDSPYLSPHPMRGRRNDPGNVLYTAQKLADIRNMDIQEISDITLKNGREIFEITQEND